MRRLAPKRERQRFVARAVKLLLDLGAEQEHDRIYLQTRAGRLMLHVTENAEIGLATVFTRFDSPEAGRQLVDCNQYSGKWNHHYFSGWTAETALADFTRNLDLVLETGSKL